MTHIKHIPVYLWLMMLGAALLLMPLVVAVVNAQEPVASPEIVLSKVAEEETAARGDVFGFRVIATNSGDLAADVVIRDSLPANYDWFLVNFSGDGDCVLDGFALTCEATLAERHLEEQPSGEVIFVNGRFDIILRAVAHSACQTIENFATLTFGDNTFVAGADVDIGGCATPTPTATNTPTPTATPTATSTPTPTPVVPTATPTRVKTAAPGPPSTGNSLPPSDDNSPTDILLFAALGLGAIAFGTGGVAVARRFR